MVTMVVTSTTQSISAGVLLDLIHNNGHLPKTNHVVSLLKRAGSTVVEYFEWDLPKVLSQGIAELLKDVDNGRFSPEPDVVESDSEADS